MDGQFDHNEFEHFLKQNADAHRLYPSDRIWTRIYARLHGRRRLIPLLLLLPLLTATGWFVAEQLGSNGPAVASTSTPLSDELKTSVTKGVGAIKTATTALHGTSTPATSVRNTPAAAADALSTDAPASPAYAISALVTTQERALVKRETINSSHETALPAAAVPLEATLSTAANTAAAETSLVTERKQALSEEHYPLDIESVVNSYQRQLHQPRFRWQLHFTPTVSYRSLIEDQKFIAQARMNTTSSAAAMANSTDLASVIRHRPDIGMQLGITGTYPISKKVDWVTGIQFNVSKYDIAAYNYPSEVATIALMNPWGGTSTVSTLTSFRSSGFRSTASWLRNYYYSVSLPIGLQWRVLGKKQTHWGISATVQPTYMVGNRSYVISVDYQNYAEVPYLINKWNLNIGLETYARFQLGHTDFQVGPQLRYQALSSFKKGYPVQEHLYDFGIKLGVRLGK